MAGNSQASFGWFIDGYISIANQHPYLWSIYAFIIILPFVVVINLLVPIKPRPPRSTEKSSQNGQVDTAPVAADSSGAKKQE